MNFREINIVARFLPEPPPAANLGAPGLRGSGRLPCPFDQEEMVRFVRSYNEPNFAWLAASSLASTDAMLPIFPHGSDRWFYRCWLLLKDTSGQKYNEDFDPIREAFVWNQMPEHRPTRELIEALLLCPGSTTARVASVLNIEPDVVEAYECLFFNVIDRRADSLFLRNVVYPDTKMEEMVQGYFEKANLGWVLRRLGYNYTMEDVLHFAGVRQTGYREGVTEAQAYAEFQQTTMANGCILASSGFLNFHTPVAGLAAAKTLATSANMGGKEQDGSAGDLVEFHTLARNVIDRQYQQVQARIAEQRLSQ